MSYTLLIRKWKLKEVKNKKEIQKKKKKKKKKEVKLFAFDQIVNGSRKTICE